MWVLVWEGGFYRCCFRVLGNRQWYASGNSIWGVCADACVVSDPVIEVKLLKSYGVAGKWIFLIIKNILKIFFFIFERQIYALYVLKLTWFSNPTSYTLFIVNHILYIPLNHISRKYNRKDKLELLLIIQTHNASAQTQRSICAIKRHDIQTSLGPIHTHPHTHIYAWSIFFLRVRERAKRRRGRHAPGGKKEPRDGEEEKGTEESVVWRMRERDGDRFRYRKARTRVLCSCSKKAERERQTFGRRRLPYLSDLDPICQAPFFACNVDLISIPNGFWLIFFCRWPNQGFNLRLLFSLRVDLKKRFWIILFVSCAILLFIVNIC